MARFNKVTPELIEKLRDVLGAKGLTVDPEKLLTYQTDEEGNPYWFRTPEVVVFPETTEQVATVVKLANEYLVPITPRAAGSGVACGAIPVYLIMRKLRLMDTPMALIIMNTSFNLPLVIWLMMGFLEQIHATV